MRLQGVSAFYEGHEVLSDINLQVLENDAMLLIGPSGSGKSTLAMLLGGLIPESVEADVKGGLWRDPALLRPGGVGYVFQDPESQFCQLTIGREVAFGLENMGMPTAAMPERVAESLRTAGLRVDPEEFHGALSGGMKQKLAIAAALAMRPALLILDEPTANLDPESAALVFQEIGRLRAAGQTLIVIEHRFTALTGTLPRVVAIGPDGRVAFDGPTREMLEQRRDWLEEVGVLPSWQVDIGAYPTARRDIATSVSAFHLQGGGFTYAGAAARRRHRRAGTEPRFVFRGLDVDIPKGVLTAIVGPNGSGKSTLLSILAGFDRLQEGTLSAAGGAPAFAFQNPEHQFIHERVADELASRYLGEGPVPKEISRLLMEFGLSGHEDQSPFALSQGQKRRLSVAAMLVQEHDAYLLDEPTFGQDARTQEAIMDRMEALVRGGRTVVLTTHDMDLVRRHAQHVIVLGEGGLLYAGPPDGLFAREDVLKRARLLADRLAPEGRETAEPPASQGGGVAERFVRITERQAASFLGSLNPGVKLATTFIAMAIALFAHTITQGILLVALPVLLMPTAARLSLRQTAVRLAPFIVFFALYTWTLTAYAAAPPGSPTVHVLFFRLSLVGFHEGLVLAMRMLSSVAFAVLYVSTTDVTDLVVSACMNFRAPPKFAYGTLAGLRFFPLFEDEWRKLRRARSLRGKSERLRLSRVVTYALPLLSQAIRLGERVAIAMEARGFRGLPAESPAGRTYYRPTRVRPRDFAWLGLVALGCMAALWLRG